MASCLGGSKLLLKQWTESRKCSGTQYDIYADVPLTNKHIRSIRAPTEIHRKPHGLNDLKYWKGVLVLKKAVSNNISFPVSTLILHNYYRNWLLSAIRC